MKKLFLVAIILTYVFCIASVVSAQTMTDAQRQALIAQIQQQIAQLTQQLNQLLSQQGTQTTQTWCHTFNTNLGYANSGSTEVSYLHTALQSEGISYSPDDINTYSTGTSQAVIQFQTKYGISPQSGYVGAKTRAKLNALYGCSTTSTATSTACTPNWTCGWGLCANGYQSQVATDLNNCGLPLSGANIACPALARTCVAPSIVCTPNCTNSICGSDDGCGGKCQTGNCPGGTVCTNGQCVSTSVSNSNANIGSGCIAQGKSDPKNPTNPTCCSGLVPTDTSQSYCQSDMCQYIKDCEKQTPGKNCTGLGQATNGDKNSLPCCSGLVLANNPYSPSGMKQCAAPVTPKNNGDSCAADSDCQSGHCVNQICSATACMPNWNCTDWSVCSTINVQTRTCTDSNNCGTTTSRPALTQSCANGLPSVDIKISTNPSGNGNSPFNPSDTDGPINSAAGYSQGLKWASTNTTSCTASGDWSGTKATSGYQSTGILYGTKAYIYTITCTGVSGTVQDSVIINVGQPLTTTISASPSILDVGDSATLTWSSTGATSCQGMDDWSGTQATSGSVTITPAPTAPSSWAGVLDKKYTIFCQGPLGTSQDSIIVEVRAYDLTFSASPNPVKDGGSTTLTWSSIGAISCTAMSGDWSGSLATSGSQTVGPLSSSNSPYGFWISCTGPLGENRETVSVQVQSGSTSLLDDIKNQLASIASIISALLAK